MNTTMMTLEYMCARIDTLNKQCENMTTDKIKERLDNISKDLKEVAFNIAAKSKGVWNLTGITEAQYHDWYWNVYVKDLLSDEEKKDILKE